jgi:glucosyl-3-phosphoglycerate phosphatase
VSSGVTRLVLWRHGHTEWNAERRVQGHTDTPLSALGRAQAAEAAPLLAALVPDAIVASDLRRCTATAEALATLTGLPVRQDPRLRERFYGDWEGLTMAEIAERWPDSYARKTAGVDAADLGHDIERPAEVMKRVGESLRETADAHPRGTTVVVSHGGALRYGVFDLLGLPPDLLRTMYALVNCHYSEVRLDPVRGWVLHAHNVGLAEGPPGYE